MDDLDDDRPPRHWGDIGFVAILGIVGLFTVGLILAMLLGYHPYAVLFSQTPAQAHATPSDETTVGIIPEKPK